MKTLNRTTQIEVAGEWQDPVTFLDYDFSAKVIVSSKYEIEAVDFLSIDVYDGNNQLDSDTALVLYTNRVIKEQLKTLAGSRALEKCQEADFEAESES